MIALLQRVSRAEVRAEGRVAGRIGAGVLVFLGCQRGDGEAEARTMARRIAGYRVFADAEGRTNLDLTQVGGEVLVVSQFTLAADTRKGRRPSFDSALAPEPAAELVELACASLREAGLRVEEGVFGAEMEVELLNHGPASYLLEVRPQPRPGLDGPAQVTILQGCRAVCPPPFRRSLHAVMDNPELNTITKRDLVQRISDSTGQTKVLVRDIIQRFLDEVSEELVRGNRLEFRKFGVFEVRSRPGRIAQNPKTLEKVAVPPKRVVKFKVGNILKKRVEVGPQPKAPEAPSAPGLGAQPPAGGEAGPAA